MDDTDSEAYERRLTKAMASLSTCVQQVQKAIDELAQGDQDEIEVALWTACARAEYALFLIALNLGDRSLSSGFKKYRIKVREELPVVLQRVMDSVTKDIERIKSGLTPDVYEDLLEATSVLVHLQEKKIRH